jgi:hypothetical protein
MPQAPSMLSNMMFEDDSHAWGFLRARFTDDRGLIRPKDAGTVPTKDEGHAIDYLCLEWDYDYASEPKEQQ